MLLHLLAWKTWNFSCDLPCSELSKAPMTGMRAQRGLLLGKPANPCCSTGRLWLLVQGELMQLDTGFALMLAAAKRSKTGKGVPGALSELFLASCGRMSLPVLWLKPQQSCGHAQWRTRHDFLCVAGYLSLQWAGLGRWTSVRQDECLNSWLPSQQHNQVVGRSFPGGNFRQSCTPYCSSLHD